MKKPTRVRDFKIYALTYYDDDESASGQMRKFAGSMKGIKKIQAELRCEGITELWIHEYRVPKTKKALLVWLNAYAETY